MSAMIYYYVYRLSIVLKCFANADIKIFCCCVLRSSRKQKNAYFLIFIDMKKSNMLNMCCCNDFLVKCYICVKNCKLLSCIISKIIHNQKCIFSTYKLILQTLDFNCKGSYLSLLTKSYLRRCRQQRRRNFFCRIHSLVFLIVILLWEKSLFHKLDP